MQNIPGVGKVEGDEEVLLYLLQLVIAVPVGLVVASLVNDRVLGDALAFAASWAAIFPVARRTWAAETPTRRYWQALILGAAVMMAIGILRS